MICTVKTNITRFTKEGSVIEVLPFKTKKEAKEWMKSFYYQENLNDGKRVSVNADFSSAIVEYDGIEESYIITER